VLGEVISLHRERLKAFGTLSSIDFWVPNEEMIGNFVDSFFIQVDSNR
jgi:hypothetical protein